MSSRGGRGAWAAGAPRLSHGRGGRGGGRATGPRHDPGMRSQLRRWQAGDGSCEVYCCDSCICDEHHPEPEPEPAPAAFDGARPGHVFRQGDAGLGYYRDTRCQPVAARQVGPTAPAARGQQLMALLSAPVLPPGAPSSLPGPPPGPPPNAAASLPQQRRAGPPPRRVVSRALEEPEQAELKRALARGADPSELLTVSMPRKGGKEFQLERAELLRLRPQQWLTDPVVNLYTELLQRRADDLYEATDLGVHCMHSTFYNRLSQGAKSGGYNYEYVRTWTRRVDLFSKQLVIFPINISNVHWCLAVARLDGSGRLGSEWLAGVNCGTLMYFDSDRKDVHGGRAPKFALQVLETLRHYFEDEWADKKKMAPHFKPWYVHACAYCWPRSIWHALPRT